MIRATITALLLAGGAAAHAQSTGDPRLVERLYNPLEVVVIDGKPRVQATIAFAEDEQIENVAIGDSSTWQVTPNKRANLLFVKPLSDRAETNMTVVTDRRTYLFDLVARPDADAIYVLRFTYPEEPEEQAVQMAQAANPLEMAAASDPYAVADPARLNFAWKPNGAARLFPTQAYDDGTATFLAWSAGTPIPAILIRDEQGTEGPVNFAVRGDTIVVDGVPREIVLRLGDDTATIVNEGPIRTAEGADASLAMNRESRP